MTSQTRSVNKGRFEDGDSLSGSNFVDLIDSFMSLADTTAQVVTSDIQTPRIVATTEVSTPTINVTDVNASVVNCARVSCNDVVASAINCAIVSAARIVTHGYVSASSARIPILDGPVEVRSTAGSIGRLVLCQQVEISGNNTKKSMTLPAGSDILDIKYIPRAALSATAGSTVDLLVGTSADDIKLARFTNVSGMFYQTKANDVDVSGMASVSGASSIIIVHATAVSGAIASAGRGVMTIVYVQKQ